MGKRRFRHASAKRSVIFAWPQRGQTIVRDVPSERMESVRSITIEELEKEWTCGSVLMAMAFRGLSCDIHEDCDGSCSDGPHYPGVPLIDSLEMDMFSILLSVTSPHPSRAAAQDVPRDFHWLEKQHLPKLEYSIINSLAGEIRLLRVKKGLFRSDIVECDLITRPLDGTRNSRRYLIDGALVR